MLKRALTMSPKYILAPPYLPMFPLAFSPGATGERNCRTALFVQGGTGRGRHCGYNLDRRRRSQPFRGGHGGRFAVSRSRRSAAHVGRPEPVASPERTCHRAEWILSARLGI